ncbi:MAG TPA: alpha-amylase/4-alpha-glucanotransferase domain-containing protein [bacterium]
MKTINVAFGIHNHQPVGNFDFVFEGAYNDAYLPFLELLEQHPKIRMAQHYTGILFQWIKDHQPEFIPRLKRLVKSGQIEMMTGGFYEPILSVIPYRDKIGQIKKLTKFVKDHTAYDPKGMWLAERIWEPQLPKPINEAGVSYVVLDDSHFKSAGLQNEQLLGYYITEEEGAPVYLFPISETLRYTIPFQKPEKTIEYLQSIATEDGQTLVVFADDGEKFGVWPGTNKHCYQDGWLEQFFTLLEANLDWIQILHFSEALKQIKPMGRIYLPTASYREMMEWAMPTRAIHNYEEFESILKKQGSHDTYKAFVRGGFWRNFMAKYPEANNMHKKMLHISDRLGQLDSKYRKGKMFQEAQDHLWAGQCNCPYWHGVFGGLYLNHLRFATYRQFIEAERILDQLEKSARQFKNGWLDLDSYDYDSDGLDEIIVTNKVMNLYFAPERGGSLFELDYKPKAINLLDTMTRREESYHKKLLGTGEGHEQGNQQGEGEIASIHDLVVMKEEGLQNHLHYDFYWRTSLLDHFLKEGTTLAAFAQSQYAEAGDFLTAPYNWSSSELKNGRAIKFWRTGLVKHANRATAVSLEKKILLRNSESKIVVNYKISNEDPQEQAFWFGSELDFALLAGDAHDRYFAFPGHELSDTRLRSMGEINNTNEVYLIDEWLGLRIGIKSESSGSIWRFPIETISQSEAGFERVYQSSVVFLNWKFQLQPGATWSNRLEIAIEDIKR